MKLESHWLDTAPPFTGGAQRPVEGRADVVVIGGGVTGLSAALTLARRRASVVVLEAGRVVGEASGRNGGHCSNGLPHDYAALVQRFGAERARMFYLAYGAAVDGVEQIVREESIDCDFQRRGRLKLAAKPGHFEKLARPHDVLRANNVDLHVTLVPAQRIREEVGA